MKNILLAAFSLLLLILTLIIMFKGLTIGSIKFYSFSNIAEQSSTLKKKVEEVNSLNDSAYKDKLSKLQSAKKKLSSAQSDYTDIASVSTEEEIREANQTQVYDMEFLWSSVGNHATYEGVKLKMDATTSGANKYTLSFTVKGAYEDIRNFVRALEEDPDLSFRIQGFKLVGGTAKLSSELTGTFEVTNIAIKEEKVTSTVKKSTETKSEKTDSTSTNATTENTTNTTTENTTNETTENTTTNTTEQTNTVSAEETQVNSAETLRVTTQQDGNTQE